jgi:hypothetical protein
MGIPQDWAPYSSVEEAAPAGPGEEFTIALSEMSLSRRRERPQNASQSRRVDVLDRDGTVDISHALGTPMSRNQSCIWLWSMPHPAIEPPGQFSRWTVCTASPRPS